MSHEIARFIENHVSQIKPLLKEIYLLQWRYDTTGDESLVERKEELEKEYLKIYSNHESLARLEAFASNGANPMEARQIKLMLHLFRFYKGQGIQELADKMIKLETRVNSIYNHFRGTLDGKAVNNNQIYQILREETDNETRKKAWETSKQIGREVSGVLLELVRLRNQCAREAGYRDFYVMSLDCREMSEEKLFETMAQLDELTIEEFSKLKRNLDEDRAKKFGIEPEKMMPWHYADPFFQEVPPHGKVDINQFFRTTDIESLTRSTYQSIGMDIDDILQNSDLYPKEGKCQHAYCTMVDREIKDIRILCNIDKTEQWASTMLHEFGHGVYDKYIDPSLPYMLHNTSHTLSTEAIAIMMESLSKNPEWLVDVVKASPTDVKEITQFLQNEWKIKQLIFVRWGLVMVYFERDLYRNPDQDLNTLWWDYVEKFQLVNRPAGRNEPDWAAKIHIATSPVYYQNYLYGQMVAAQLLKYIQDHVGNGRLYENPDLGNYLIERYFKSGRKYDWNTTLQNATGESLNPEKYARELTIGE